MTNPEPERERLSPQEYAAAVERELHRRRAAEVRRMAKVRTLAGDRCITVGPEHYAVTDPPPQVQEQLVALTARIDAVLAHPGKLRVLRQAPEDWRLWGRYGGVAVLRASRVTEAKTVADLLDTGLAPPADRDSVVAADGAVLRTRADGTWWYPDPSRAVELEILRVLCEDPLARLSLSALDERLADLPRPVVLELLGHDPGRKPNWFERARAARRFDRALAHLGSTRVR